MREARDIALLTSGNLTHGWGTVGEGGPLHIDVVFVLPAKNVTYGEGGERTS